MAKAIAARWHVVALGAVLAVAAFLDFLHLGRNGYANSTTRAPSAHARRAGTTSSSSRSTRAGSSRSTSRRSRSGSRRRARRSSAIPGGRSCCPRRSRGSRPCGSSTCSSRAVRPGGGARRRARARRLARLGRGQPRQQPRRAPRAAARRRRLRRRRGRSSRGGCARFSSPRPSSGSRSTRRCSRRWSSCPASRSRTRRSPAAVEAPPRLPRPRRGRPRRGLRRLDRCGRSDPGEPTVPTSARRTTTAPSASRSTTTASAASPGRTGGTSIGNGGGLGGAFSGSPGALRLLNDALGDQGGVAPAARARRRPVRARDRTRAGDAGSELAALAVVGGWFVAAAFVFSFSSGIIHTYYLSALAPATCALVGIGVGRPMARRARRVAAPPAARCSRSASAPGSRSTSCAVPATCPGCRPS